MQWPGVGFNENRFSFSIGKVKAKFHYASWLEAGSKLVADQLAAKFH